MVGLVLMDGDGLNVLGKVLDGSREDCGLMWSLCGGFGVVRGVATAQSGAKLRKMVMAKDGKDRDHTGALWRYEMATMEVFVQIIQGMTVAVFRKRSS